MTARDESATSPRDAEERTVEGASAPPRPVGTGFAALVGQDAVVTALRRAVSRDRLPHTLAFHGPVGVGKATCAGLLARALNCPEAGPDDACGRCTACRKIVRGLHPDVLFVEPEDGLIKVDTAREIAAAVAYRPHEGRRRVVIIDDAHLMNPQAQNALLKTLEEPPASSVLVLVTPTLAGLLPTVRSRSQSVRFGPLPPSAVRSYLRDTLELDAREARLRAALAPGSLGRAIELDLESHRERTKVAAAALQQAGRGGKELLDAAEEMLGVGIGERQVEKAASVLQAGRDVLRDLLVLKRGDDELLINADLAPSWRPWADSLSTAALLRAAEAMQRAHDRATGRPQPNAKLTVEKALVEVGAALQDDGTERRGAR